MSIINTTMNNYFRTMLHIDILTLHPELLKGPFDHSILKRAKEKKLIEIDLHNIRDYSTSKHKQVDDYAFGGGAGMVMMIEPIDLCLQKLNGERSFDEIIYMTPDGELLNQQLANQLSMKENIAIICGHYKGVDERVREHFVTKEISIGSYVMSGGELPAAVLVDTLVRLVPGVLNDETSALFDSFQDQLLAPPVYTRPEIYNNWKVPEILLSGDFKKIESWRHEQAVKRTQERRPDILPGQE